jgi:hypothetical protein
VLCFLFCFICLRSVCLDCSFFIAPSVSLTFIYRPKLHILHIHLHIVDGMLATLNLVVSPVCKLQGTGLVTVSVASIVKIRAYCVSSDIDTLAGKLLITGG